MTKHAVLLSTLLLACAAQAAEPPASAGEAVEISATRDPAFKPYKLMLAGLDTFERLHALAPAATLRFLLRPQQDGLSFEGLQLRIAGDDGSHDVPVDANGYFTLPRVSEIVGANADMVTNRKKGLYRWRPSVRTPGLPNGALRMGDLRLECEVRWTATQDELPLTSRLTFKALGGPCNSKMVNVMNYVAQPVRTMTLTAPGRRETLPANPRGKEAGHIYAPPLHDKSWPDDTLIEFDAPAQGPAAQ